MISSPQEGGGLDLMAPGGLFQLCDSDSDLVAVDPAQSSFGQGTPAAKLPSSQSQVN